MLLVDDEEELLEIYQHWVRKPGRRILTAPNGAAALKVLASEDVDVLLTDIRMPVMDGITLVRRLWEGGRVIPSIIFISGFAELNAREAYNMGVVALLSKPTPRNQLSETIDRALADRDEAWAQPLTFSARQELTAEFESFEQAQHGGEFRLGCGGCNMQTSAQLELGELRFRLRFRGDERDVVGQGWVRWTDFGQRRVGIEFGHLEAESRAWIVDKQRGLPLRSFIPA